MNGCYMQKLHHPWLPVNATDPFGMSCVYQQPLCHHSQHWSTRAVQCHSTWYTPTMSWCWPSKCPMFACRMPSNSGSCSPLSNTSMTSPKFILVHICIHHSMLHQSNSHLIHTSTHTTIPLHPHPHLLFYSQNFPVTLAPAQRDIIHQLLINPLIAFYFERKANPAGMVSGLCAAASKGFWVAAIRSCRGVFGGCGGTFQGARMTCPIPLLSMGLLEHVSGWGIPTMQLLVWSRSQYHLCSLGQGGGWEFWNSSHPIGVP